MRIRWQVEEYSIRLHEPSPPELAWNALIGLRGERGWHAYLFFYPPGTELPDDSADEAEKEAHFFLPAEKLSWYIDLLRNEKPLAVEVYPGQEQRNVLATEGAEPIGEAE